MSISCCERRAHSPSSIRKLVGYACARIIIQTPVQTASRSGTTRTYSTNKELLWTVVLFRKRLRRPKCQGDRSRSHRRRSATLFLVMYSCLFSRLFDVIVYINAGYMGQLPVKSLFGAARLRHPGR